MALIWLFLFSSVSVERVEYLIIGTAAISSGNLVLNFECEFRRWLNYLVAYCAAGKKLIVWCLRRVM